MTILDNCYAYKHIDSESGDQATIELRDHPIREYLNSRSHFFGEVKYYNDPTPFFPRNFLVFGLLLSDADYKHKKHKRERYSGFYFSKQLNVQIKFIEITRLDVLNINPIQYNYYLTLYSGLMLHSHFIELKKTKLKNWLYKDFSWAYGTPILVDQTQLSNCMAEAAKIYKKYTKGTQRYDYNIEAIFYLNSDVLKCIEKFFPLKDNKNPTPPSIQQPVQSVIYQPVKKEIIEIPQDLSTLTTRLKLIDL